MRATSETISEQRRALMLPQELKLLSKSKAILLMAGVPPIIADKIIYYKDKAFLERVLPAPVRELPKGRSTALINAEIRELRSEVAELRAVFQTRPLSDEEGADPSTIPSDATFDFGDVDVDLEGLSEEEMKAWTLSYIDAQAVEPARRSGRTSRGERHERHG